MNKNIKVIIIFTITILLACSVFPIANILTVYYKYKPIEDVLVELDKREYSDEYNCIQFSQDAVKMLEDKGIKAIEISGEDDIGVSHRWIGIEFKPQSNGILKPDEYNSLLLSQNYKYLNQFKGRVEAK